MNSAVPPQLHWSMNAPFSGDPSMFAANLFSLDRGPQDFMSYPQTQMPPMPPPWSIPTAPVSQSQLLPPYPPPYNSNAFLPASALQSHLPSNIQIPQGVPSSHQVQHHPPERYLGPPPPRPGFVTRTVPQHVWDPYTKLRSRKNAMDVTLHFCPDGITPLDTQRITFDLAGQIPGTGIPLALLDSPRIEATLRHLTDANELILVDRQRIEGGDFEVEPGHSYSYIELCMAWPAYPLLSRNRFRHVLTIRNISGYSSRARILKDCSRHFTEFFKYAQAAPNATTGAPQSDLIWAFGPGGLSFDNVSLVALYQMAGQFFLGEFYAELPRDVWDRHLDTAPVPMTY